MLTLLLFQSYLFLRRAYPPAPNNPAPPKSSSSSSSTVETAELQIVPIHEKGRKKYKVEEVEAVSRWFWWLNLFSFSWNWSSGKGKNNNRNSSSYLCLEDSCSCCMPKAKTKTRRSPPSPSPPSRPPLGGMSLEEKFKAAVKVIHSLPKDGPYQPSNGTKLKFYGLFKQATEGPCNTQKPGFWDVVGKYKWEAWKELGNLSKDKAMEDYVDMLKEIVETMSWDGNVQEFLNTIGPFYEFVNVNGSELNHVKEQLDRLTSSSDSSSQSSLGPSPVNSCPDSPLKNCFTTEQNGDGYDTNTSTSTVIEDMLAKSRPPTYESVMINGHGLNGNGYSNGYHDVEEEGHKDPVAPSAPSHKRKPSHKSQSSIEDDEEEEETLGITVYSNPKTITALCKEDLEKVPYTSGGESQSEKYYSGDSEPDFDDRLIYSNYQQQSETPNNSELSETSVSSSSVKTVIANPTYNGPGRIDNSHNPRRERKTSPKSTYLVAAPLQGIPSSSSEMSVMHCTVERMTRDIDHILARLRILETAYATSANEGGGGNDSASSVAARRRGNKRSFFGGLSPSVLTFIVMWPFAVHFILRLISWWWTRRRLRILMGRR